MHTQGACWPALDQTGTTRVSVFCGIIVVYLINKDASSRKGAAMNIITTEVVIENNHRLNLDIELPPGSPTGEALVTVTIEPKKAETPEGNRLAEVCGLGKGKVWMAEDFDAPLEDFAEYM
jgi:hypothetical protein